MRKTKIIGTMGPSSETAEIISEMIRGGLDAARINLSHGDHAEHLGRIKALGEARKQTGRNIPLILDTKGPEIRLGNFKNKSEQLASGAFFTLTTNECEGTREKAYVNYKDIVKNVKSGSTVLLNDGLITLEAVSVTDTDILCKVVSGGIISDKKKVNLPGAKLTIEYLSEADKRDLLFGIENDVDFVAASFVRGKDDCVKLRRFLNENGGENIELIAKIESQEGVDNIEEILGACDGIMIARGDLGVEINFEELPQIQKNIIKKCALAGKLVITATEMLESMITKPRPTRAEVSDVANAVYDGTGVVMLSGETATGANPVLAVKTMAKTALFAEENISYKNRLSQSKHVIKDISDAISHSTCAAAHDLNAKAIISITTSGSTAKTVSRFRPGVNIVAVTPNAKVQRKLSLYWGVTALLGSKCSDTDMLLNESLKIAADSGFIKKGDIAVLTAGIPIGISGTTNMIKIEKI